MEKNNKIRCCICGLTTKEKNNAEPFSKGDCCNTCNELYVVPARIEVLKHQMKLNRKGQV